MNTSTRFVPTMPTEEKILFHWYDDASQGTLALKIEEAEKLCNELAIAIIQAKEHNNTRVPLSSEPCPDDCYQCAKGTHY